MTEPPDSLADPRALLLAYLDYYRATLLRKLDGLSDEELRTSGLPSGWTPLAFVERRWLRWGFRGEDVDPVWGETDPETGKRSVGADESAESVRALFLEECAASRTIVSGAQLQEYARHVGQLDVVRELVDGE